MEHLKSDLVVIGTGGAGMAAAITAAERGVKVVQFEKRAFPGGASNTPVAFRYVKKEQAFRDKAFKVHMTMTRWTANADLVRAWINMSGELPEWMAKIDVDFTLVPSNVTLENMGQEEGPHGGFPSGYNIADRCILHGVGLGHGGAQMIKKMVARAKALGVQIHFATPVKEILKDGDRISGVIVEDKAGKRIQVDAKAVIVATAGFNEDPEMIKKYGVYDFTLDPERDGSQGDVWFLCNNLKLTGDGIKMAWEIGADKGSIGIGLLNNVPGPGIVADPPWIMLNQLRVIQEQPYLWVNHQGERFIDESYADDHMTMCHAIARQNPKYGYVIFDSNIKKRLEEGHIDYEYFIFKAKKLDDVDGQFKQTIEAGNRHVFVAETIKELAEQMGVDSVRLQTTIDLYNGYCEKGHDAQFAKNPKFLHPVKEGKFYAMRNLCSAYQTIGGINVNGKTEVLKKDSTVIPGLYAAGDIIAAELFGDPPTIGIGTLSNALSTGRIAAESASGYLKK